MAPYSDPSSFTPHCCDLAFAFSFVALPSFSYHSQFLPLAFSLPGTLQDTIPIAQSFYLAAAVMTLMPFLFPKERQAQGMTVAKQTT